MNYVLSLPERILVPSTCGDVALLDENLANWTEIGFLRVRNYLDTTPLAPFRLLTSHLSGLSAYVSSMILTRHCGKTEFKAQHREYQ